MKPNGSFLKQNKVFWAHVRSVSQHLGYTVNWKWAPEEFRTFKDGEIKAKKRKRIKIPSRILVPAIEEICAALKALKLRTDHVVTDAGKTTDFGALLLRYFQHRAHVINTVIKPNLMDVPDARKLYEKVLAKGKPAKHPAPMNKQKGKKKAPAYLTALVNLLIERNSRGFTCNFDPMELTSVTKNRMPVRTLARRVDGAFPQIINPVALWEIKEYYYTTTFGSRVADGIYESLLDGLELEELSQNEGIDIKHYLIIDSHYTWWESGGRPYLCRIVDMLHMGYVDEVLVGREVVTRLPELVGEWIDLLKKTPQGDEIKKTGAMGAS
ncbi:MAG: hypothetical protein ABSE62_13540 [Chthoniobacteraceae bacterium]|jgi:hypothetical protein